MDGMRSAKNDLFKVKLFSHRRRRFTFSLNDQTEVTKNDVENDVKKRRRRRRRRRRGKVTPMSTQSKGKNSVKNIL